MSGADAHDTGARAATAAQAPAGLQLAVCAADIVEFAASRGQADALRAAARSQGLVLPDFGRLAAGDDSVSLSVRPDRWLVLSASAAPGEMAANWQRVIGSAGAAIDQSSGLEVLHLAGTAAREVLARGCRLDLDPSQRSPGLAAATVLAQVPAIIVTRAADWLLLTPSTTARHVREWLASAACHDGFQARPPLSLNDLLMKENP